MPRILNCYDALVAAAELKVDEDQRSAAQRLQTLQDKLETSSAPGKAFWDLFRPKPAPARGVYLWGGVGRGKSMLMDLFAQCLSIVRKRRVHFHEFMQDVHERLRIERLTENGDPIIAVAKAIATEAQCLAFDEFMVNNSADAMIMSRLFTHLIELGVTLVITSNRPPANLYKDGLNREHFLPFIALIEANLDILGLNGPVDYRLDRLGGMPTWHTPLGDAATAHAREAFFRLTDYPPEDAVNVPSAELAITGGRTLHVPKSLKGVAVFSFARLCRDARGVADYQAIAQRYHTVIIVGIPIMGPGNRNEAARFVLLIDVLYEHNVKLIATAGAEPESLYTIGDGSFEFERTVSRLIEMQSVEYLAAGHGRSLDQIANNAQP